MNFCDELPLNSLTDNLTKIFSNTTINVTVCYGRIEIPPEEYRQKIIEEAHNSLISGHTGVTKTYQRIRERFTWPRLRGDVVNYIRKGSDCVEQKITRVLTRKPMMITDTPLEPFD